MLVGALDKLKGRKDHQSADGDEPISSTDDATTPLVSTHTRQALGQSGGVGIGAVISAIGGVMSQLEKAAADLSGATQRMSASERRVMALLAGGRGEKMARPLLKSAQEHVKDAHAIVTSAQQNLRSYLTSL